MTATQISIETAPRDLAGLKSLGRFNLRVLAQQLGAIELEATKQAFMQQDGDAQAAFVLKHLQERDGTGGKAKAGASPRQPSTKGAGKASAAAASSAVGEATQGTGGGGAAGGSTGAGAEKILVALNALSTKIDSFQGAIANLQAQISQLQIIGAGTNRFVALSIGLAGKLAEQTLGASLEQILDVVLEDLPSVEAAMQKMPTDDTDEEETDAGNDE